MSDLPNIPPSVLVSRRRRHRQRHHLLSSRLTPTFHACEYAKMTLQCVNLFDVSVRVAVAAAGSNGGGVCMYVGGRHG